MLRLRFIGIRLASLVGLLLVLSAVLFTLQELSGADPVAATIGGNAPPQAVEAARERMGLNRPPLERYLSFVGGLFTGDLGTSFRTHRPVAEDILASLPATMELVVFAFVLALILGILFAVSSMLRWPGSSVFRGLLFVGSTAPTFLLGILGLVVFYKMLDLLPARGRADTDGGPTGFLVLDGIITGNFDLTGSALQHLLLPGLALAVGPALSIGRVLRSSLIDTYGSDYVRTATSKGLDERNILFKHVLRNSVNAALSMSALQLGFMFGGVLLIESVFSWGGLGSYLGASLPVSDFPAVAGVTFVLGALYITVNTAADILQSMADPRIAVS
ncbi:ABC transporter permease [Saccharopolyspora sp. K220]|uniref:ABC transporter permease n=1 Tax=Saccharopolyspora soli TaxID=2926618 RepID=UPI001F58896F|nr:ABC transporter permease [Saccharopolyspora soli]MCI2424228.1 ABC transporter permease [Saccharopolyspora soli]